MFWQIYKKIRKESNQKIYEIEHEDDDYTSHNNEPEMIEDVPMETYIIKKEVKKSKKRKKDSVNDQEEIPKKQKKQK